MPRGRHFSEFERGQILAYYEQGLNFTKIGEKLGRHRTAIAKFLKNPTAYGTKNRSGRPRKWNERSRRRVLRACSSGELSSSQIKTSLNIPLSRRTVQRIIASCPHMRYLKRKMQPRLGPQHIHGRLSWAQQVSSWTDQWKKVVFSDEKKFNLDGPDGWQYYWHDLRKEPQYFSRRVQGGGSVMVWAAFGDRGKTPITFLEGRQTATLYQNTLNSHLLPYGHRIGGRQWVFQQDNAPIHSAGTTREWFLQHGVRVLEWPSRSPDLNPIENLWGSLVRRVYAGGRQFDSINDLKEAITIAWEQIEISELRRLVDSMHPRVVQVLIRNGKSIHY